MIRRIIELFQRIKYAPRYESVLREFLMKQGGEQEFVYQLRPAQLVVAARRKVMDHPDLPALEVRIAGEAINVVCNSTLRRIEYARTGQVQRFVIEGPIHSLEHLKNITETIENVVTSVVTTGNVTVNPPKSEDKQ